MSDTEAQSCRSVSNRQKTGGKRGNKMLVQQVVLEANNLNLLLDEYEVTRKGGDRDGILRRALNASIRGVQTLAEEPFTRNPAEYLQQVAARFDGNPFAVVEELRQDASILRMFLAAESRLLLDLGVDARIVDRIRHGLATALTDELTEPEATTERLNDLLKQLQSDLASVEVQSKHRAIFRRIVGVVQVLGAGIVIAGNGIVGAPGAVVTAGVSLAGAAVSIAAGSKALSDGIDRARQS
jgi:hypothetical protein